MTIRPLDVSMTAFGRCGWAWTAVITRQDPNTAAAISAPTRVPISIHPSPVSLASRVPPSLSIGIGRRRSALTKSTRTRSLQRPRRAAELFLAGVELFGGEHLVLGALGAPVLLTADLGDALGFGAGGAQPLRFQPTEEDAARKKPVQGLRALLLTAHLEAARAVAQDNAGRDLVDVLPAGPAR